MNNSILKKLYSGKKALRMSQFLCGMLLAASAYNIFYRRCNLVYGVSGIGLMVNHKTGIDPSIIILCCNIILLGISYIFLGKESTKNTILGSLLYPLCIKLTQPLGNIDLGNLEILLVTVCGSLMSALGLGLVPVPDVLLFEVF